MPSVFPNGIDSFTPKADYTMYEFAADMNDVQQALVAIEQALGVGLLTSVTNQSYANLVGRLNASETTLSNLPRFNTAPANIGVLSIGGVASVGTSGFWADAGHVHAMPAWGGSGTAATVARSDHGHAAYLGTAGGTMTGPLNAETVNIASGYNLVGGGPLQTFLQNLTLSSGITESYNDYGTVTNPLTVHPETYRVMRVTLGGNITITFPNTLIAATAYSFVLHVVQDGTGGRALTWGSTIHWPNGVVPTIPTGANSRTVFTFTTIDGGATYDGFLGGTGMA